MTDSVMSQQPAYRISGTGPSQPVRTQGRHRAGTKSVCKDHRHAAPGHVFMKFLFWITAFVLFWSPGAPAAYGDRQEVQALIDELVSEGLPREHLEALFASAKRQQGILDAIARPAERTLTWGEYQQLFVRDSRIEQGLLFWHQHSDWLARARSDFGIPEEIIVAIIGIETNYGRNKGQWRVLDALTTLGFDYPPRARFFRGQLKHLIMLEQEAGIDPGKVTGSYAGAMGYPQFIPSSYRSFALDYDGDGRIDLLDSTVDAIGSVANYLHAHRWVRDLPVAARVAQGDDSINGLFSSNYQPSTTLGGLSQKGVRPVPCTTPVSRFCFSLPDDTAIAPLRLTGTQGDELWLTTDNFYAITRYNHSELYAMAVYHLATALREKAHEAD